MLEDKKVNSNILGGTYALPLPFLKKCTIETTPHFEPCLSRIGVRTRFGSRTVCNLNLQR
jgi:hypothetical protein